MDIYYVHRFMHINPCRDQSKSGPGAPAPERHAGQCRVVVSGEPGEEVTLDFF